MGARMVTPRRAAPSGWKAIERLDASLPQNGEFLGIDEGDCVELFAEDAVDRLAVIVERVLRRHEVEILDAHVFSLSWDGWNTNIGERSIAVQVPVAMTFPLLSVCVNVPAASTESGLTENSPSPVIAI